MLITRRARPLAVIFQILFALSAFVSLAQCGEIPTRTIIDILSSDPEFSTFLDLLQRHALVPLINRSYNSTLLAPVNSAFVGVDKNKVTRENLLYHFLKYPLVQPEDPSDKTENYLPTYLNQSSTVQEPVYLYLRGDEINNGASKIIDSNLMASQGRGSVQAISDVLQIPPTLCQLLLENTNLSYFAQLANIGNFCQDSGSRDYTTVFAPSNDAFDILSEDEKSYLILRESETDRAKVIARQVSSDFISPGKKSTTVTMHDGTSVSVDEALSLNGTITADDTWLLARDGVVHVYPSCIDAFPVNFTAEKYLLALGGRSFVHELRLYGYRRLIDGYVKRNQTIFLPSPKDSSLEWNTLLEPETGLSARDVYVSAHSELLYQFTDNVINFSNPTESEQYLFDSKMPLLSKKHNQKIKYYQRPGGNPLLNWKSVLPEPHAIDGTTIYLMDGRLPIPPPLAIAVGPLFSSSYSLEFLDELELLTLPHSDSWTVFLPTREAWEHQYLLKQYFDKNPKDLRVLFNYYLLRSPLYSDASSKNSTAVLFDGTEVSMKIDSRSSEPGKFTVLLDGEIEARAEISDILFDNGVAHCISEITLPRSLRIDSKGLIKAGDRSEFIDLMAAFNLTHVLNGVDATGVPTNYSILVPNITALAAANYTASNPATGELLKLHIFQGEQAAELLSGNPAKTLSNHELILKLLTEKSPPIYSVGPDIADGKASYVSSWARTNSDSDTESAILILSRFISPDWMVQPIIPPQWRLKSRTLVLMGILLGLMIMSVLLVAGVFVFTDDTQLPLADEERPLLQDEAEPQEQQEQQD